MHAECCVSLSSATLSQMSVSSCHRYFQWKCVDIMTDPFISLFFFYDSVYCIFWYSLTDITVDSKQYTYTIVAK